MAVLSRHLSWSEVLVTDILESFFHSWQLLRVKYTEAHSMYSILYNWHKYYDCADIMEICYYAVKEDTVSFDTDMRI